jgi:hypothetical protein
MEREFGVAQTAIKEWHRLRWRSRTDCDKGVAQSLTTLVLTSCVSSLKPYCLFVRDKYYSSQYLRFFEGI